MTGRRAVHDQRAALLLARFAILCFCYPSPLSPPLTLHLMIHFPSHPLKSPNCVHPSLLTALHCWSQVLCVQITPCVKV